MHKYTAEVINVGWHLISLLVVQHEYVCSILKGNVLVSKDYCPLKLQQSRKTIANKCLAPFMYLVHYNQDAGSHKKSKSSLLLPCTL